MRKWIVSAFAIQSVAVWATVAVPSVGDVDIVQDGATGAVTVSYTLKNAPAIITLDVCTNGPSGWASIGGANIGSFTQDSAVWKKVDPSDTQKRTITFFPGDDGLGASVEVKAVVSAWSPDNPPDYLVANLEATAQPGTERYYPSVDFLPGGVLSNTGYRTTKLLMRKIMAANVPWMMGTNEEGLNSGVYENAHDVKLTSNYYIGVFQFTQAQYMLVVGSNNSSFSADGAMRPANQIAYNEIRCAPVGTKDHKGGDWPGSPYAGSFLSLLNARTGLSFDLPGEAQWEFACRAGNEPKYWGNGKIINKKDLGDPNMPGRHRYNGGYLEGGSKEPESSCLPENGPATVGSYQENSWGIYDMHGNVFELCLDWYETDITTLNGAVNIDPGNAAMTAAGKVAGNKRVRKGGSYHVQSKDSRSTNRLEADPTTRAMQWGFRVACHAGNAEENAPVFTATHEDAVTIGFGRLSDGTVTELDARSRSVAQSDAAAFDSRPPFGFIFILK